jgi:hypothetical protein
MNQQASTELLEKQLISEALYRYCRGIDRMDKDLLRRVFLADLRAQYAPDHLARSVEELIDWLWGHHLTFHHHSHQVSNILIELDGDTATSESYLHARLMRRKVASNVEVYTVMGRYLDRWKKRDGDWRIAERRFLTDFMDIREIADLVPEGTSFAVRDPDDITRDPSYEIIDRGRSSIAPPPAPRRA